MIDISTHFKDGYINAFQTIFKMLVDTVGRLIIPMELTYEVLNTQIYEKVDGCRTLEYNFKNCKLYCYVDEFKHQ